MASTVESVNPNSAAQAAGMQPGDKLVSVDGHELTPVLTDQVAARIRTSDGEPVAIVVERDGKEVALTPTPRRAGRRRLPPRVRPQGDRGELRADRLGPLRAPGDLGGHRRHRGRRSAASSRAATATRSRARSGSSRARATRSRSTTAPTCASWRSSASPWRSSTCFRSCRSTAGTSPSRSSRAPRRKPIPRIAYERASALGIVVVLMLFFLGLSNDVNRLSGG